MATRAARPGIHGQGRPHRPAGRGDARSARSWAKAALERANAILAGSTAWSRLTPKGWRACGEAAAFGSYVTDTATLLRDLLDAGQRLLCEGAQGTLLDLDHGHYPT